MRLVETVWRCFRNLESRHQEWCPGLNIIFGPNGSGKTNLLESLNILCGWSAFGAGGGTSAGKLSSLPAWDSADGRAFLAGRAAGEREVKIEVRIGARASLRAGNERVTHSALRALLPSLSFLPGDAALLDASPGTRRFFLDKLCALCSPLYARRLAEYKQLLRHRTALLRSCSKGSGGQGKNPPVTSSGPMALAALGIQLARFGGWIRDVRRRAVTLLAEKFSLENGLLRNLLPCEVGISMLLQGTLSAGDTAEDMNTAEEMMEDMRRALAASFERERHAGTVLVGPHRDDLLFSCRGRSASLALSRGQKRRVVMAAILAAGQLIEEKLRLKPILILDDIAAELDTEGRDLTGLALAETGWQVFASAAGEPFGFGKPHGGALWHIQTGKIKEQM